MSNIKSINKMIKLGMILDLLIKKQFIWSEVSIMVWGVISYEGYIIYLDVMKILKIHNFMLKLFKNNY